MKTEDIKKHPYLIVKEWEELFNKDILDIENTHDGGISVSLSKWATLNQDELRYLIDRIHWVCVLFENGYLKICLSDGQDDTHIR